MAFTFVHGLIAFLIVYYLTKNQKLALVALIAGMLPDLDAIPILWDINLYYEIHHEWFHAPVYGILIGIPAALLAEKYFKMDKIKTFAVFAFSFIFHGITDVFTTAWPVKLLWPFSQEKFVFPVLNQYDFETALIVLVLTGIHFLLQAKKTGKL